MRNTLLLFMTLTTGCVDQHEVDEPTLEEVESELGTRADVDVPPALELTSVDAQRYCVDQSYASADSYGYCDGLFMCPQRPNWDTSLSRNHAVVIEQCAGTTYVYVRSLWNEGRCYVVRRDALRKC